MTLEEYFKEWLKVIPINELNKVLTVLGKMYKNTLICPNQSDVFKAFELCDYSNCKVVFLGQEPYPQKNVATGILFGNSKDTKEENLSPSLKIVRDAAINLHMSHYSITFDQSLESWCKQGILMLNSALTCEMNKVGSHTMLWRPFISKLLQNYSIINPGTIYVLFGKTAQTFKPYISNGYIIEVEHPAYFARTDKEMPVEVFQEVNKQLKFKYNTTIEWYKEI